MSCATSTRRLLITYSFFQKVISEKTAFITAGKTSSAVASWWGKGEHGQNMKDGRSCSE